jgi:hypothetical protein
MKVRGMVKIKEAEIEKYFVRRAKELGGLSIKMKTGDGMPDRLYIPYKPDDFAFIEFKQRKITPSKRQQLMINSLISHGIKVFVVDSKDDVDFILKTAMAAKV